MFNHASEDFMKYFFAFLATLGLTIIVVILLISGGGGGGKKSSTTSTKKSLPDYANTDAVVSFQTDGTINADSLHNQIRISVSREQVVYEQISGYQGNVVATSSFVNNQEAFSNFLYAIGYAGFTQGRKDGTSPIGHCPLGKRYTFKLVDGSQVVENYWSTSCNEKGNFKGNLQLNIKLFQLQVPGYSSLVNNVDL